MNRNSVIGLTTFVVWLMAIAAGRRVVLDHETRPGPAGLATPAWPAACRVARTPGTSTLLLFAHPHCPCSRASLAELARIMARRPGGAAAVVLFLRPEGFAAGWERTDLWRAAEAIPGVTALADPGGVEARRFGARTSGQVALFGPDGRLAFRGGITGARGHAGDNDGADAVLAGLAGEAQGTAATPTFGCPLFDRD